MKKKILLVFVFLFSMNLCVSFASFYENNENYQYIGTNETVKCYVYVPSIKIIRNEDPYYILQCDVITINYVQGLTWNQQTKFIYNRSNHTMQARTDKGGLCDNDGSIYQNSNTPMDLGLVPTDSLMWGIGNFVFKELYNVPF